jgi:hypothetical protein
MEFSAKIRQDGISLVGLIFVLVVLGLIAVVAMRVTPTVTEYLSIKNAISSARASASTAPEIRSAFDRQASVGYIDSIAGKDLDITKNGDNVEVSFAYQKKIPLVGPTSLLIDYAGSTAKSPAKKSTE